MASHIGPDAGPDQKPAQIGGWLFLLAIQFVLGLAVAPLFLIAGLTSGAVKGDPVSLLFNAAMYVWLWIVAIGFFKKRSTAPRAVVIYLLGTILADILIVVVTGPILGPEDWQVSKDQLINFAEHCVSAAVWVPYFRFSKRVRATFIRRDDASNPRS